MIRGSARWADRRHQHLRAGEQSDHAVAVADKLGHSRARMRTSSPSKQTHFGAICIPICAPTTFLPLRRSTIRIGSARTMTRTGVSIKSVCPRIFELNIAITVPRQPPSMRTEAIPRGSGPRTTSFSFNARTSPMRLYQGDSFNVTSTTSKIEIRLTRSTNGNCGVRKVKYASSGQRFSSDFFLRQLGKLRQRAKHDCGARYTCCTIHFNDEVQLCGKR